MKCLHKKCSLDDTLNMLFEIYGCWMLRFISLDKGSQTSRVRHPAIITHGGLYTAECVKGRCDECHSTVSVSGGHKRRPILPAAVWTHGAGQHILYTRVTPPRHGRRTPAQQHSVYFNPNTPHEIMKSACFSVICAYLTEWWRNDECRVQDPGIPCVNITSHHLASLAQTDDAMKKWVLNEWININKHHLRHCSPHYWMAVDGHIKMPICLSIV